MFFFEKKFVALKNKIEKKNYLIRILRVDVNPLFPVYYIILFAVAVVRTLGQKLLQFGDFLLQ